MHILAKRAQGYDLVFVARQQLQNADYPQIKKAVEAALRRVLPTMPLQESADR